MDCSFFISRESGVSAFALLDWIHFHFRFFEFHATGFEALATFDWFNIKSSKIPVGQSLSNNIIRDCPSEDGFEFGI